MRIMAGRTVVVNGCKVYYRITGHGLPVVFIHGACEDHSIWDQQVKHLSGLCRTVVLDLPGHGRSDPMREVSIDVYSDFLRSFLREIGIEKAVIVGHSMGGAIALKFCLMQPEMVLALILVDTGAKLGVHPAFMEAIRNDHVRALKQFVTKYGVSKSTNRQALDSILGLMCRASRETAIADFEACDSFDVRDQISNIKVPTLIIVGREDSMTPLEWSEFMRDRIEGSKIKVIPGSSHFPMIENPQELNRAMEEFIMGILQT